MKKARTKATSIRLDQETDEMIDELRKWLGGSRTSAIRTAVRVAHRQLDQLDKATQPNR